MSVCVCVRESVCVPVLYGFYSGGVVSSSLCLLWTEEIKKGEMKSAERLIYAGIQPAHYGAK